MCVLVFLEQTPIISLYCINLLALEIEECVYRAVRTESLNKSKVNGRF